MAQLPAAQLHFESSATRRYEKLVRHCDDGHANFQKIRNQKLWAEHEQRNGFMSSFTQLIQTNDNPPSKPQSKEPLPVRPK